MRLSRSAARALVQGLTDQNPGAPVPLRRKNVVLCPVYAVVVQRARRAGRVLHVVADRCYTRGS